MKVWMQGKIVDDREAMINVFDHGLLYGDGVFEGIRFYNGVIFRSRQHLERLEEGCRVLRLPLPYSLAEIEQGIYDTIEATGLTDGYIRLVVTRGSGGLGLSIRRTSDPIVFAIVDTIQLYPAELYKTGLPIVCSSVTTKHPQSLSPRIKSLNYLPNILAKIEAEDRGFNEAVMFNPQGYVAECTGDNIFVVKDGVVSTPGEYCGILKGITRGVVIELCEQMGIPLNETTLTRHELYAADEVFLTGSAAEVIAVSEIDQRPIGPTGTTEVIGMGPITKRLLEGFHATVKKECAKRELAMA